MIRLFAHYRSSTSYRVRIGLQLKGLAYDVVPVDLLSSEQQGDAFRGINPFAGVPCLEYEGRYYAQSMAILEWLDERFPDSPLLPKDIEQRFAVREAALAIATELHAPLNLPVLRYLKRELGHDQTVIDQWYRHWLAKSLGPLELRMAQRGAGSYLGERPGLFEAVLIPQLYNARSFEFDLSSMPNLLRIEAACLKLPEFIAAHPKNQPDAP